MTVASDGPSEDEIARGRVQAEAQFVFRLQSVGGFGGKSDQLNAYNTYIGDPDYFGRDLARYQEITPRSVQAAVARYLESSARVVLSIVPKGRTILAMPGSQPARVS